MNKKSVIIIVFAIFLIITAVIADLFFSCWVFSSDMPDYLKHLLIFRGR